MTPASQQDCMYDPRDALTDTVATLVFMPSKFDRSTMQLAEKINSATPDQETLNVSIYHLLNTNCTTLFLINEGQQL